MKLIPAIEFLAWARTHEITPDERYSEPRCLVYVPYRDNDRFWEIPDGVAKLGEFVSHLLAGTKPWNACYLWLPEGRWPRTQDFSTNEEEAQFLRFRAAGIPDGFEGALEYSRTEQEKVAGVMCAELLYGRTVYEDLFVIPDHCQQLLQTDHHGVVHVSCVSAYHLGRFEQHMTAGGFQLPEELPDQTFKKPNWMK